MKIRVITFFTYTCLTILGTQLLAQNATATDNQIISKKKDVILGVNLTGTGYYGDINYMDPQDPNAALYFSLKPGIGASVGFEGFSLVQPAINFGYGAFIAQNPDLKPEPITAGQNPVFIKPTKYINTSFIYTDLTMRFTPLRRMATIDPYLMLGVGGLYFTPRKVDGTKVGGNSSNKYSPIAASIPFSLGTEVRLNKRLSMNLGLTARFPLTDNMDNSGDNEFGAFNRQQGNDKLFGFNLGANYRIVHNTKMQSIASIEPRSVEPNPALARPASEVLKPTTRSATPAKPASFVIPEEQKLPKSESLILATTIDLRENPTYMAMLEWKTNEPQDLPKLFVDMVQTSDCDSMAKLFDLRLANLNNENQQLRIQYTKLSQETQKLREDNEMFAAKEKALDMQLDSRSKAPKDPEANPANSVVSSNEALRNANAKIDSLSRQMATLQLAMTSETAERQKVQGALDSLASVSQEKDALIAEMKLKGNAGTNTTTAPKPSVDENATALENEMLARIYTRKVDSLTSIVTRLERQYRMMKNDADILKGQKSVLEDRIQQANKTGSASTEPSSEGSAEVEQYAQSIDSLVKENQYLQAQLSDIKMQAERVKADHIKEIATVTETVSIDSLLNILASKETEYTTLYKDYLSLKQQNAPVNSDVQMRIAAMQKQVEDLLANYADMQQQRDAYQRELENEKAQKAMVTQDPASALRILIANTQRRVDSMNSYYTAVQQRIEGYEVTINRLRSENDSMSVALAQQSAGGTNAEPMIMAARQNTNNRELEAQIDDYRTQVQDMGNEIQAYKAQLADMTDKVRMILEKQSPTTAIDKSEFENRLAELEGQLKVSQEKVVELAAENDGLKQKMANASQPEDVAGMQGAIAAMQEQINDNEKTIKQLEAENRTYRAENEKFVAEDKSVDLAKKVLDLEAEKTALFEENVKLKAEVADKITTTDPQILQDQLTQLKSENDALRRNSQVAGNAQVELEEMKDKYAKMEAEYNAMKVVVTEKTESTAPLQKVKDMEAEIATLNEDKNNLMAQLAEKSTEAETAKEKAKELEIAAGTKPQPDETLVVEVEKLKQEREAANAKIAALEAEKAQVQPTTATIDETEVVRLKDELTGANEKIAVLTQEKADIAAKLEELKNTSTPATVSSDNEELAKLQADYAAAEKKIATLEQEKAVLISQLEVVSADGGEIPVLKAQVTDLKAIVESLKKEKADAENNESATTAMVPDNASQEKIAELTEQLATANQQIADLKGQAQPITTGDNSAETIAKLEAEKKDLEEKLASANARVIEPTAAPVTDAEIQLASANEKNALLTEQLASANQQITDLKAQPAPSTDNETVAKLEADKKDLEDRLAVSIQQIQNLKAQPQPTTATDNSSETIAKLEADKKDLEDRLAVSIQQIQDLKAQPQPTTASDNSSETIAQLEAEKKDLEAKLAEANARVATEPVSANVNDEKQMKLAQLETERDAIQKQLEENTQYISKVLQEKDEAQRKAEVAEKRASMLEEQIANMQPTPTSTTADNTELLAEKDSKIAMLNERIAVLQEEIIAAKSGGATTSDKTELLDKIGELERMVASQKEELARKAAMATSGDFSAQLANMDMREKKLAQRENYLALKEEEIRRNEAKFEYLNAKEIELKLLEQRVSGFYSIPETETHEGAPCAYTTATIEKEEVLHNLDDYFLGLGYSYTIDAGKLVYTNVVVPEISNKPMNISFYMRTSQTGKRTLQGVFRYSTGVYITEDKYPAEYIKVLKFLQRIAQ
ncbi:MAG: hypothetical protein ACKVTZ_22725 [Bacteroidia bacterium]